MEDSEVDLGSWLGKPPPKQEMTAAQKHAASATDGSQARQSYGRSEDTPLVSGSDGEEKTVDGVSKHAPSTTPMSEQTDKREETDLRFTRSSQLSFSLEIPKYSTENLSDCGYLPGHFKVRRVISRQPNNQVLVKLQSGEKEVVSIP